MASTSGGRQMPSTPSTMAEANCVRSRESIWARYHPPTAKATCAPLLLRGLHLHGEGSNPASDLVLSLF